MSYYTDKYGGAWKFPEETKENAMSDVKITPVGKNPETDRRALAELLGIHILDPYPQPAMMEPDRPTRGGTGAVYLAGPISGLTYREARFGWRQEVASRLDPGITVLSPMRHEGHLSEVQGALKKDYPDHFFSKSKVIFQKDVLDIKRADVVLVNFLGVTDVSKGSLVEIGMAYAWDKFIIVLIDEGGIYDHPFVTEPASAVLHNLDDAIAIINSLLSEGV